MNNLKSGVISRSGYVLYGMLEDIMMTFYLKTH